MSGQYLLEQYKSLLDAVDPELQPLMICHTHKLYLTLRPAAVSLTWNVTSLTWTRFFAVCQQVLEDFRLFFIRLCDIRQNRLLRILDSLHCFSLRPPERDRPWPPDEFIEAVKTCCRQVTLVINNCIAISKRFNYDFNDKFIIDVVML